MGGAGAGGMAGGGMGGAAGGGMGGAGGTGGTAPVLFFSEYVEGSPDSPDALEILNNGTGAVNLATCRVLLYLNASTTPSATMTLTGTLAAGDVFVLCSAAIGTSCDLENDDLSDMTGNDAVSLVCTVNATDSVEDVIGQIGVNPAGGEWGNTTLGTGDQTLRRMCSVTGGDTDGTNTFNPATEWVGFPVNTTNGLGLRTCPCPGTNVTCP